MDRSFIFHVNIFTKPIPPPRQRRTIQNGLFYFTKTKWIANENEQLTKILNRTGFLFFKIYILYCYLSIFCFIHSQCNLKKQERRKQKYNAIIIIIIFKKIMQTMRAHFVMSCFTLHIYHLPIHPIQSTTTHLFITHPFFHLAFIFIVRFCIEMLTVVDVLWCWWCSS